MLEQNKEIKNENIINDLNNKNKTIDGASGTKRENPKENKVIRPSFVDTFKANIIDLIVIGAVSTIVVFVADAILKLTGYAITQKFQMIFIIFMIIMVLYMSIMESGKSSATIGKKASGLLIIRR
ncbi:RDD family protein [Clostridium psychrophilum]|uniref:RDD family protein n=1 Tax=Clostridium psychrophilum TaxID=132926 RepID=UPI001C0CDC1B|nr:RDD family protein [Clostridium psychrophilum]MBU3181952.1 RDD family protein [Clostridium psychrophilum]